MEIAIAIAAYFLIGTVAGGLTHRFTKDGELGASAFIAWPLVVPLLLLVTLYIWLSGDY